MNQRLQARNPAANVEIVDRPECDYTLRTVIRCGGARVVWAIAGRSNLADSERRGREYFRGYKADFPEDRIYASQGFARKSR